MGDTRSLFGAPAAHCTCANFAASQAQPGACRWCRKPLRPAASIAEALDTAARRLPPLAVRVESDPPHSGAETSRAAAEAIKPGVLTLRARVLRHIRECGDHGCTDAEGQAALEMSGNTYRPRRLELEQLGRIRQGKTTRKTPSGRSAVVWVAVTEET